MECMCIRASGKLIKNVDMGLLSIPIEINIREIGRIINLMGRVRMKNFRTVNMRVNSRGGSTMEMEPLLMLMEINMKGSFKMVRSMGRENMIGKMEIIMMENGKMIQQRDKVHLCLDVSFTMESSRTVKETVKVS